MEKKEIKKGGKILNGIVTSDKMKDTCTVIIEAYEKAPKYGKFIKKSKKYKVDDKGNTKKIGDKAEIMECAPISKDKHFRIVK